MIFHFITAPTDRIRNATQQVMWRHHRLQAALRRAGRLVGRAAAILVAGPDCFLCGKSKAETLWVLDPIGGFYGVCGHCAESTKKKLRTDPSPAHRD